MTLTLRSPAVQALKFTILTCAISHLVLLAVVSLTTHDYQLVNMFNITNVSLIFPQLGNTVWGFWLSQATVAALYLGILLGRRHAK